MRRVRLGLVVAFVLAAGGFGIGPVSAADQTVAIVNDATAVPYPYAFSPASKSAAVGDKVTWTNSTGAPHTVSSDSGSELDSMNIEGGSSFSHTFTSAGTYAYHCNIHSNMHGTIVVSAAATTTTAKATTTTARPATTVKQTTTSARATTTSNTQTTDTIGLDTTTEESTTSTTEGQVAIKSKGGTSGGAIALLVVAIAAVLGGGGYALYRLRSGRF